MGKELVVSSDRHETKVAILEDGQLVEVYFQRGTEYSLAGSIHKGRVTRVLPGMQSAFVDLGLERDTFLYVSDFFEEHGDDIEHVSHHPEEKRNGKNFRRDSQQKQNGSGTEVKEKEPEPVLQEEKEEVKAEAIIPVENGSGEDRRGRRRRRRRGGGSKFPDSKFASADEAVEENEAVSEEVAAADEPVEVPLERIILPGESLAKYKRNVDTVSSDPNESEIEEEAPLLITPVSEPDAPIHHPVEIGEMETVAEVEVAEDEPVSDAAVEDEDITEQVLSQVEEKAEERVVVSVDAAEVAEAEVPAETEEVEELEALPVEEAIAEAAEVEEIEDAGEEQTAPLDESQEVAVEAESSEEKTEEDEEATNGSAQVREGSGGRFLQRSGRRNRRRRGGDRGGDRGSDRSSRNQEQQPAAVPEVEKQAQVEEPPVTPHRMERPPAPSITDLLKEGQEILVQIAKEPLGQKGARITSHIALPGRYCVYMPTVEHTGVSRKIASDEERQRLKKILLSHKAGIPGGFIIRTAGEDQTEADIAADISYLYNLWLDIRAKAEKRKAPALVYHDLDIVERTLRDQLSDEYKAIWCDTEEVYESVLRFIQRVQPTLVSRVKLFTRPVAIFDAFNVTTELEKALRPKVWLKSGGYIVINQTEALVAIDINTGKFVGKSNRLEDTIVKTNTEAVKEIVRQIRLRDLGGIIVIDFIDMDERKNRQKVMQALEEAMRADRAPYKILQFNDFGLVAVTRKRVKQSLERTLCQPCPYCEGAGYVRSIQTVISDIVAEARKIATAVVDEKECILRVNPEVAKILKSTQNTYLEEVEGILKKPVAVISDPLIHHEKFDLA